MRTLLKHWTILPTITNMRATLARKSIASGPQAQGEMTMSNTEVKLSAKARAFRAEGIRKHRFVVDLSDNSVRVWDSVAGYYTICHSLSKSAQARLVKLAKASDR